MQSIYRGSRDVVPSLEAALHNYFRGGYSGKFRDIVHILVNQMKKLQVKTISELMEIKVNGKRSKNYIKKDWSKVYQLAQYHKEYWSEEETATYEPVSNDTVFKDLKGFYYNTYKYGGQFDYEDYEKISQIESGGKPISDFLNYVFNRYTEEVAIKKIEASGWDEYSKRKEYKIIKR